MLDKIAIALISPLGTALGLLFLAGLLALFRFGRSGVVSALAGFCWLLVWSLPIVSTSLLSHLERQFPVLGVGEVPRAEAIVVLGGGLSGSGVREQPLNFGAAADRVWFGAQLFLRDKAPWVVLTGGAKPGALPEAEAMATVMTGLGVPEAAIIEESRSRNTRQNAEFTAELLLGKGIEHIILVTSAYHMKRAVGHFEDEGLEVIPAPTDYDSDPERFASLWLPDAGALEMSGRGLKEWVGQLVF